ncbi:RICIN domain-containing protein [Streptomyces coeruleoprunus]|uniref:RICIN domain-containing protein n=1 Tax=Streptomyces coeruleoprunus TaxID=285563 RepID=A0ABV9XDG2_9ACTN
MKSVLRAAVAAFGSAVLLLAGTTAANAAPADEEATYVHIVNRNSGQCLAVPGGSTQQGTGLIQWGCGSWNDHYWTFRYAFSSGGLNYYQLENLNSHQCLAVPGASTQQGTQVIQWPCGTWKDHYWGVRPTSNGAQLVNWNSRQCLAIEGGSLTAGAKAIQWPCGTWRDHYWTW